MPEATLTSKGQVTIPKKIRKKLQLNPGDKILFQETEEGDVKIITRKKSIRELRGILHRPGQKKVTVEEMKEGIKQYLKKKHEK
ncbi:MAG TPA: type II toxin-antitoxin system PrlF family antitoxin [Fodinibius sp.]|nr:type II toxin-antitoxin system PrlF family antitoxin [Fodinibius sp.]